MKMKKITKIIRQEINNAFSLVEIILSVTLISIFFSSIFFGFFSIIKIENVTKIMVYKEMDKLNTITEKFYIKSEDE